MKPNFEYQEVIATADFGELKSEIVRVHVDPAMSVLVLHNYQAAPGPASVGNVSSPVAATTGPLDRNPAAVYLATLRPTGRRTMHQVLDVMAGWLSNNRQDALTFDWSTLRYQHTAAIAARCAENYKSTTANKMLAALRRVLKEAWQLGLMDGETYHRATALPPVRGQSLPAGRALPTGELTALLGACADDVGPAGARDAALIAVLYGAGLRRSELVALDLVDFDHASQSSLAVRSGKGNKARLCPIAGGTVAALLDWLTMRGDKPGPLFGPINRGGRVLDGGRMSDQAVRKILIKRAKQAHVNSFSPHDLRRTFITHLLEAGADIVMVQQLAGHANVITTARYDRRGEVAKRKAASLLHVPYQARPRLQID